MSVALVDDFESQLSSLNINDTSAVKDFALRIEALEDPAHATELCTRSKALRRAVGLLRSETLASLLARDEREEFIRLTADPEYMEPVDLTALRVPRYVAVEQYDCSCGVALMVPYPRGGGPDFGIECPSCAAPYLAHIAYGDGEHHLQFEADLRPAKKRKKRQGVL